MAGDLINFFGERAEVDRVNGGIVVFKRGFDEVYTIPKFVTVLVKHDDELL